MIAIPDFAQPGLEAARRFFRWWTSELAASVPALLKQRLPFTPAIDIMPADGDVSILCYDRDEVRHLREAQPLHAMGEAEWDEFASLLTDRSARLILDARDILELELDLPRPAGRNLPTVIAMQLELLSPVRPDHIIWTWAAIHVDRERARILVVMARKSRIADLERLFARHGLECPPIWCRTSVGHMKLQGGRKRLLSVEAKAERRVNRICLAVICALPVLILAGAQLLVLMNEARLNILRQETAEKRLLDQKARRDARTWQAYAPLRAAVPAGLVLSELSTRVPQGLSLESMSYSVRGQLSFELAGGMDEAALRSMVEGPGHLSVNWPAELDLSAERLALTADIR